MEMQQRPPFAVVTGASNGIGFELAKVFAENGFDLLLTAEDEGIEAARRELDQFSAGVECMREDLASEEGVGRLYERIRATGRSVDALALRNELEDADVTVASPMPGPTETEFFERADMLDTPIGEEDKDDPAEVAVKAEMHRKVAQPATASERGDR